MDNFTERSSIASERLGSAVTSFTDKYYSMDNNFISKCTIKSIDWLETYTEEFSDENWENIARNESIPNLYKDLSTYL